MSPSIAKFEFLSEIVLPWEVELFIETLTGNATEYHKSILILYSTE